MEDLQMPAVLAPPPYFALVCPSLFRSSLPLPAHVPFLQSLNLKLVIFLSAEAPNVSLRQLVAPSSETRMVHLGAATWHSGESWRPLNDELIKRALELILDARANAPTLVVCASGVHETGAVVACLRRMQRWNTSAVFDEYRRFAGSRAHISNEHAAELFDLNSVSMPPSEALPPWFLEQLAIEAEERLDLESRKNAALNAAVSPTAAAVGSDSASTDSASLPMLLVHSESNFTSVRGPFFPPRPLTDEDLAKFYSASAGGETKNAAEEAVDAAAAKLERKKKKAELAARGLLPATLPVVINAPEVTVATPPPSEDSTTEPAYQRWFYAVQQAPLVSRAVVYSKKKSLVVDED